MIIVIDSIWELLLYGFIAVLAWHAGETFYDYLKSKYQERKDRKWTQ